MSRLLDHPAIKEGHNLSTGAIGVRTECSSRGALGYAIVLRPFDCCCKVVGSVHIAEHACCVGVLHACKTSEERDDLTAGTDCVGAERRITCTLSDALGQRPFNSLDSWNASFLLFK